MGELRLLFFMIHHFQQWGRKAWIRIRNTPVKPMAISKCLATKTLEMRTHVCSERLVVRGQNLNHTVIQTPSYT